MLENEEIGKIFKALCDPKRVAIIKYLKDGEKCACKISQDLNFAQSALSYHMKILCDSGLIKSHAVGKWTHYELCDEGFSLAMDILKDLSFGGKI